jgi:hypothetical protein
MASLLRNCTFSPEETTMSIARHASILAAAALCASAARAQELVTFHWSFQEVLAGTTTPGLQTGAVRPGEGARIFLSVSFMPAVGTLVSYTPPPGTGLGEVGGLAGVFFDLVSGPGAQGTWSNLSRRGGWTTGLGGTITLEGVINASAGQFPLPGQVANPANPVQNLWSVVWTPADYTPRTAYFTPRIASAAQPGQTGGSLYINFNYQIEEPSYISKAVPTAFGSLQIPVVPAPAGVFLLAAAAPMLLRRRRPMPTR